jgi:hypothetical protein
MRRSTLNFSSYFYYYRNAFGQNNSVYADALLDKGFLLLNVDSIKKSVEAYKVISA